MDLFTASVFEANYHGTLLVLANFTDVFQLFAFKVIDLLGFSTSASVRPHKKAVKKLEAEGAKEKQLIL